MTILVFLSKWLLLDIALVATWALILKVEATTNLWGSERKPKSMENQTRRPEAGLVAETPEIIVGIAGGNSLICGRRISQQADDAEQQVGPPAMNSGSGLISSCQRAGHNEAGLDTSPPKLK